MKEKKEKKYEELLLEVRRVTRVTTGGRRLSFRATILVGNRNGAIGIGLAKAGDVSSAVTKATHEAYKNVFMVPVVGANTIPYEISHKYKAARIKLLPATAGTGLKAGSAVRSVLDLAGYNNILSKIIGTNNKLNNALATIYALSTIKAEVKNASEIAKELEEIQKDKENEKLEKKSGRRDDKRPSRRPSDKKDFKPSMERSPARKKPESNGETAVKTIEKKPAETTPAKKEDKE